MIGKNDIEDALRRLDGLTQEEARMAAAQLLKVTNTIDNRVEGIPDDVLQYVVENRMSPGIDDSLRVSGLDERVPGVVNGAQYIFNQSSKIVQLWQSLTHLDGIEARRIIKQAADDVDRVKCS